MLEITRQVSGIAKKLETSTDFKDLLDWAVASESVTVTVSAKVDGTFSIQCEGVEIPTVYAEMGNWIVFDGERFIAYPDDDAFEAAGYVIPE